jgi:hypothetical protein
LIVAERPNDIAARSADELVRRHHNGVQGAAKLRHSRELTHYVVHYIMQSIFSPAARRQTLRECVDADRRDGRLRMDWTNPLHYWSDYGY